MLDFYSLSEFVYNYSFYMFFLAFYELYSLADIS
jgi:hypothetical protein